MSRQDNLVKLLILFWNFIQTIVFPNLLNLRHTYVDLKRSSDTEYPVSFDIFRLFTNVSSDETMDICAD